MILVNLGNNAGVWLTSAEHDLYRRIKFKEIAASKLTADQLETARSLINKAVVSRKKHNGELYYTVPDQGNV